MLMWSIQIGWACRRASWCRYTFFDVLASGLPCLTASIQSRCLHPSGTSTWDDWEELEHFSFGASIQQIQAMIRFLLKMKIRHCQTSYNKLPPNVILSANLWKGFGLAHDQVRLAFFKFQKVSTVRMSQEWPHFPIHIFISAWKQTHMTLLWSKVMKHSWHLSCLVCHEANAWKWQPIPSFSTCSIVML